MKWQNERMSGYIGSERPYLDGPREAFLQLVAKFPYHDGSGCCFHFEDKEGRLLVWFSKRKSSLEIGAAIRASFVITKHLDYNGAQQNITKSFRILSSVGEA